ncbi:hypothetical protein DTL41_29410 [Escherichia coli]|nr:hypothetical protein DTL41_29410 [Escherichia coli]
MTTFTNKGLIKEIKERISSLDVRDDIERRAYEIALVSLEVEPDEREAYELFMEKRFGDLVDRRRAKNGDNEYMAWDMTLGWIVWQQRATGRLQATRKDPTKPKSPYLTTRQACIAALQSPLHTVQVSAGDGITEERKCHSSAEMKYGMPRIRSRAGNELRNLLAQRTSGKLRSCTTSEKQNSGE